MTTNPVITFEIKIDGKSLPDSVAIERIDVVLHTDQESMASFIVPQNAPGSELKLAIGIEEESQVEILLGYNDKNARVFNGTVSAVELQINNDIGSAFIVNAMSDEEYEESDDDPVLTLTYGNNIYNLDAVAHLEEGKNHGQYPSEVEVKTQGTSNVLPGKTMTLAGCTDWFDGDYEVLTVGHTITDGRWTTQVVVSR